MTCPEQAGGGRTMIGCRSTLNRLVGFAFILGIAICGSQPLANAADPSNVRAARLTYLQGTVTVNQPGNASGIPAQMNLPLLSGVQLATGQDGQAEVEFEDGSVVRLTPNSTLSLDSLKVDSEGVFVSDLSLLRGLAYAELRATQRYRYVLNAGGDLLSPVENATVRVDFDEQPAIFSVLDGTVEIERQSGTDSQSVGSGYQTDVRAGESLSADLSDPSRYFLTQGVAPNSWDQWNEDLDQTAAAQASDSTDVRSNYAGAQGYGWSDLDANGTWYNVPGQGQVWQPYAADDSGFDPYSNGGWISYPGAGYIWASAYPWGWTPYRCGNWSYFNSFGWGWSPSGGCGGFGWGFGRGGRPVNIGLYPGGYRPIHVPLPGHGPERPWVPVGSGNAPVVASHPVDRGPRQISGVTVAPIKSFHRDSGSSDVAVGSSLSRDYPVDSATRAPVYGLASTRPAIVYSAPSSQPATDRQGRPAVPSATARQLPAQANPAYTGQSHPGTVTRGLASSQVQRAGPQNNTPPPSHPTYTPSAPRPTYSPPPQPASHPSAPAPRAAPSAPARSPK
jgi:hypothetical protein